MRVPFSPPDITEEEIRAVGEVLRSGWITTGPRTKAFEKELAKFLHTGRVAALSSATAAMELTLRLLGVGPGDEVITTAYTYTASASVACHVGAKLVLVDTAEGSYEMDMDGLSRAITERTKVIIPVDLGGRMCDVDQIYQIVEEKRHLFSPSGAMQEAFGRIVVLADGAHSLGASRKGKMSGEAADFTCFSFHAVKNLTTGEGGAVTWRPVPGFSDEQIYRQYMLLSLHGQSKDAYDKTKLGAWEYDIVTTGYKCNMTDIMAAIGQVQLARYPQILERRKAIIQRYEEGLKELPLDILAHFDRESASSGHLFLVRLTGLGREARDQMITALAKEGIASNVHYKPLPMHTAYKRLGFSIQDYPHAYRQFVNEITLPLHTCLTDEQVELVICGFRKCYRKIAGLPG
ncbi:MAG: DegT/DnrJ/EryC1/StrS family aminotransferase [Lachnospiraceae bacterium]|nr:DegT/DnrJ/EryC1/StrS family aminotransferase [Lachnospiraceae bacterium]